jgi:lipopolysaccharide biosynthesis glycosyltransferase
MRDIIARYLQGIKLQYEFVEFHIDVEATYTTYLTPTTYTRLFLADQISDTFLWLDADIMCRKGWNKIFDFDLRSESGFIAAGVRDPLVKRFEDEEFSKNLAVQRAQANYVNAGVFLVDSKKWSENISENDWKAVAEKGLTFGFQFQDQCVINYLLYGRVKHLSADFNYLIRHNEGRLIQSPKIAHFSGWDKPWHLSAFQLYFQSSKDHRDLYREYSRMQAQTLFLALISCKFEFFWFYRYILELRKKRQSIKKPMLTITLPKSLMRKIKVRVSISVRYLIYPFRK